MDGLQPSSPLDRSKTCGDLTAAAAAVEPPVKRAASCPELPETKRGDSFGTWIWIWSILVLTLGFNN